MMLVGKRGTWFTGAEALSIEQEHELVKVIDNAREWFNTPKNELNEHQKEAVSKAIKASHSLVESYSMLIEKMAWERYSSSGGFGFDYDDFVAEAYVVAIQSAKAFNPSKGKSVIRFSSYVSRAISSSLARMSMRSRSVATVPTSTMSDARKWSHTHFKLISMGLNPTDDEVSDISGVISTQHETSRILNASVDNDINDIFPPSMVDNFIDIDIEKVRDVIKSCIKEMYMDKAPIAYAIIGLDTGYPMMKPSEISAQFKITRKMGKELIQEVQALINHPSFRVLVASRIN